MQSRRAFLTGLTSLGVLGNPGDARSQIWPQRPVKILVPFGAGGNTDIIARLVAHGLGEALHQQFVVENRTGATGAIAAEMLARAPADGHTLMMATLPQLAIVPAMTRTGYDAVNDFAPVSNIGTNPFVLVIRPDLPANSVAEFVAYARRQPDKLTYAATGRGSLNHLAMVLFLRRANLDMVPVMYKGGPAGLVDVIAGRVDAYFASLSYVVPQAGNGKMRVLAVSSEGRASQIPDVPTMIQSGFPGFRAVLWTGLLAPASTPKDVVRQISQFAGQVVRQPINIERLIANGVDPLGNGPDEFAAQIAADIAFWAEAVKLAGLQKP